MTPTRLFLDHAAGSPTLPEAVDLMAELQRAGIGNPNGGHTEARRARAILDDARASLAEDFGVEPRQITFTATASEALALGLHSALTPTVPLVTTAGEHRGSRALAVQHAAGGGTVELLALDAHGVMQAAALRTDRPGAVGLFALASGEVGTVQPWATFAAAWRASGGGALVVDAVQAAYHDELNAQATAAAHLVVGSAKVGGPFGIAALISAPDIKVRPIIVGGGQERGRRGGTEAVVLAAGFAAAYRAHRLQSAETRQHLNLITTAFDDALGALASLGLVPTGAPFTSDTRLAGHRSYAADWALGDDLVAALDHAGIAASTGSACISGSREPSEALLAMGHSEAESRGGLRLSFGRSTTIEEARGAAAVVRSVLERVRMAVPA
jgi:cysteine desulfurase|uniref:aminotransferase class V-fold PLP-dependent enzyme n=2 Tax=Candidatus Limnocylindrus sp. TaxID=2802978 RepID=UPI00404A71F2